MGLKFFKASFPQKYKHKSLAAIHPPGNVDLHVLYYLRIQVKSCSAITPELMAACQNSDKIPQEYVNNENPFAYIKNYSENPFLDPTIKPKLDALQQMQPKFISLGIDVNTLRAEQTLKTRMVIERQIRELVSRGMKLINSDNVVDQELVLRENVDVPGVLDILIDINKLKLLRNQRKLREKVYCTLKGTFPSNIVNAIDYSVSVDEDYLADAIEYERLERLASVAKEQ